MNQDIMKHAADNIRILVASMVENAKSGHPGGAMGGADFVNVLYSKYLTEIRENKVSFDMIVQAMKYTGGKIAMELRETSLGGLAEVLPINKKTYGC